MPLCFVFVFDFLFLSTLLASWLGKLEQIKNPPPPLPLFLRMIGSEPRKTEKPTRKLNIYRSVWVERKVILDELDPAIRRNFESRGWLPLLDV